MFKKLFETPGDCVLTFMRIMLAVVFFPHGAQKMLGWAGGGGFHATMGMFAQMGIPSFLALLVIVTEFFGPIALFLGFFTRVAALGIFVDMLVAVFLVHIHNGFFMNWTGQQKGEGFEYHLLAIVGLLVMLVKGAGALSIDHALSGRER